MFAVIKHVHVWLVLISIGGFAVRWLWLMGNSAKLELRIVKIAPHVIDTLLLLTGLVLAIILRYSPFEFSWFSIKLLLVIAYIALGVTAFKVSTKALRATFGISALFTACAIIVLAASKPF